MAQIILIYPHKPAVSHSTVSKACYDGANESASGNLLVNRTVGVFFIVKPMLLSGMSYSCVAAYHATLLLLSTLSLSCAIIFGQINVVVLTTLFIASAPLNPLHI